MGALPEDSSARYELVDGVMVASPRPVPRHQYGTIAELVREDDAYRLVATHGRVAGLGFGPTLRLLPEPAQ